MHNPLISVVYGDGAAALMTDCVASLLRRLQAKVHFRFLEAGHGAYRKGFASGVTDVDRESVAFGRVVLQAPCFLRTEDEPLPPPSGAGYETVRFPDIEIRRMFGLPFHPAWHAEAALCESHALFCLAEPERLAPLYPEAVDPSGMVLAACMMLSYIGQQDGAFLLQCALLRTLEDGLHPYGVYVPGKSKDCLDAKGLAEAVGERIGKTPRRGRPVNTEKLFLSGNAQALKALHCG
jgi:hypothetical protein